MDMSKFFSEERPETIVICPNCGSDHHESNRFEQAEIHCREALGDVSLLLFDGRLKEARKLLTTYCRVWIENILRPAYLCLVCGAQFGGGDCGVTRHG